MSRYHNFNNELDELKWSGRGAHISGIYNITDGDRDPCVIGVWFLGEDFTDNFSERDFFSPFEWDVSAFDDKEGGGSWHSLFLEAIFSLACALAQTSKFVCVWLLPHLFESWVVSQLAPPKALSLFLIKYRLVPVQYKLIWIAAAGCWISSDWRGEALSRSSMACNRFGIIDYWCVLIMGAIAVGNRCAHPRRWVPRAFCTSEILLDALYVAGWGVGSWGHPWRLLVLMWSVRFVESCVLRRASDIRTCYLRNGMRIGRRHGCGFFPGL